MGLCFCATVKGDFVRGRCGKNMQGPVFIPGRTGRVTVDRYDAF